MYSLNISRTANSQTLPSLLRQMKSIHDLRRFGRAIARTESIDYFQLSSVQNRLVLANFLYQLCLERCAYDAAVGLIEREKEKNCELILQKLRTHHSSLLPVETKH
ncbi:uncharacterized protein PHALS_15413 [Plasmopara halstedii]|uniref:Uncharacterized protein n=1 Tax=Plasmopara halstedii TaxID=4781 RepID=A0A0P1AFW1_PLAHL|nr:uncharacterized protein PHALS_15413 [Plasmopara halstedii]CEG39920.1 hypothetical protein PHALS_15413 [Plasmopara halstedii]|eukprot:XP_024576289.1 hypothetical protein PHALS_15413 [Plasmopara halstedii]